MGQIGKVNRSINQVVKFFPLSLTIFRVRKRTRDNAQSLKYLLQLVLGYEVIMLLTLVRANTVSRNSENKFDGSIWV